MIVVVMEDNNEGDSTGNARPCRHATIGPFDFSGLWVHATRRGPCIGGRRFIARPWDPCSAIGDFQRSINLPLGL